MWPGHLGETATPPEHPPDSTAQRLLVFQEAQGKEHARHQEAWGAGQEEASRDPPRPLEAPNPTPLAPSVRTPAAGHTPRLRERAPIGLVNQGATCYLNSILQCLFFTPEFRKAVLELELPAAQPALCRDHGESSLVTQLQRLFLDLQDAQAPVTTRAITRCLGLRNVYEQQDVLECFQTLLTRMAVEKVELRQAFQMLTERVIQCQVCKDETRLEEARLFLMVTVLPGPEESVCSVAEAVQALFRKEQVTGDNQYFCETCDRKEDASSELCLRALPSVLVIFLERFTFYRGAFWKLKNKVTVSEKLILPFPEKNCYNLFAVCHHFGDLTGGHYVADIMSFEKRCWYRFSDDHVEEIQPGPSESSTAYLLMYRRESLGPTRV
ncbi:ubiquitin carboxyl-terminal hydrolase 47-like isoform 2-T2 [Trichechus inunguis]